MKKMKFPPVGGRIFKSALVVYICLLLDIFRGQSGVPFYSAIAAILCIQPYQEAGKKSGWNRICGTFIGAFWGSIALTINLFCVPESMLVVRYAIMALFVIPVIYTTVVIGKNPSTFIACVVLLSINVNHIGDINPYLFVINRIVDTLIGVGVALVVNSLELPRKKNNHILFVSRLEDGIFRGGEKLLPHDLFLLNRMIDSGAKFSFITYGAPATARKLAEGIHMNLPAIILDGAALYDIKNHKFLYKVELPYETGMKVRKRIEEADLHCFATCISENTLLTYVGEFRNEAEARLYEKCYTSPYWNYFHKEIPKDLNMVYLMVIDTEEKVLQLKKKLQMEFETQIKLNIYMRDAEPGYLHLKVYSNQASPENMVEHLKENLVQKSKVTDCYMVETLEEMKKIYAPLTWEKNRRKEKEKSDYHEE